MVRNKARDTGEMVKVVKSTIKDIKALADGVYLGKVSDIDGENIFYWLITVGDKETHGIGGSKKVLRFQLLNKVRDKIVVSEYDLENIHSRHPRDDIEIIGPIDNGLIKVLDNATAK
jgi:hypothetical protein